MPKVSAIVSAYYSEPYLEGRLENLYHQSLQPETIVIAQAGSIDAQIAAEWKKQYPDYGDFILITTEDIPTIYKAWNLGIEKASGEYLTSANSDDRFYPFALEKLSKILDKRQEIAVAYCNLDIVETIGGDPVSRFDWKEGGFEDLLQGCFLGPMPLWRKSLHDKYGMFDASLHVAGDYEFWLRITQGGEKLEKYRKETLGVYLKRKNSREHREKIRTVQETSRVRSKYKKEWQK